MLRLLNGRRCIGICFRAFRRTNSDKWMSNRCQSNEYISRFIWENTELTGGQSLTPEIKLRLFTPNCRFWDERPELWPFDDPYWAIYWPGGQALSRYLLDNPSVCRGKSVLDLGSGCGASSIAAKKCGAAHVTANDIDRVAAIATVINCELNAVEPPFCVTDNMISSEPQCFDVILLGDMFYDEALATSLHSWLDLCIKRHGTTVLIGDPGRAQFEEHSIRQLLHQLDQFELPKSVQDENYGLTCSTVWHYQPDL
ncbi:electron transfer flavoprotein beta subunit lysine methyltransferase isoform X1 [Sphaeramia orbicularis]|uniref:Electron transfer flavoprotein beta subunit lysine methyltransferase n=1 Tax=Sphaeramia orbicularis TaxID=375764 RepID=A0A672YG98_9TELE|nr:electron transfer flavoprotein beta subunit lysine methyltransferase isoform X1 [Sphaeramia orbicularis]